MANISEHQREAERAHAALTSGQGIGRATLVVRAAGKDPKDRTQYEVRVLHEAKKLECLEK